MAQEKPQNRVLKYWPLYKWSNVWAMLRNNKIPPRRCDQGFGGRLVVITGATSGIGLYTARRYAYGSAKIAQLLSMHRFARLFDGSGVTINALHPGMVATNTGHENHGFYRWYKRNILDRNSQSPEISAEALYYLGVCPEVQSYTDRFFNLTTPEELTPPALDDEVAQRLWQQSLILGRLA